MIVNRFLSHLMSLEKLSNSANEKTDLDSPLSDKCHILHAKLDKLVDALNDVGIDLVMISHFELLNLYLLLM